EVQEYARASQVLEEADAQTRAFGGAFDQTGNIGHHEAAFVAYTHYTKVRHQRGEGIVGHARTRGGHRCDQGGLAGIGQTEETHVGDHLQLQLETTGFTRGAVGGLARAAVDAGFETGVTKAVEAAVRDQQALTYHQHVTEQFLGIRLVDTGAHRHTDLEVGAAGTGAVTLAAVGAGLRAVARLEAEVDQGIEIVVGDQPDAAAITAIAAIRTAAIDEFF